MPQSEYEAEGPDRSEGLLAGIRVVDFTDDKNLLCGKLLADMGATVVKVDVQSASSAGTADDADPTAHRRWLRWHGWAMRCCLGT